MTLRPYQSDLIADVRGQLGRHKNVLMQLATGAGKTRIFSEMTLLATNKGNSVWIMVPRNELLRQSSRQLSALGVSHGMISATSNESRAYSVHVVSKDTILRRIKAGIILSWPRLLIVDEAHLSIDQQLLIRDSVPSSTIFIGVTATPERLDGRGLNELYQSIVYGPTMQELIEYGYLSGMKYFRIPGLETSDLASKDFSGTEIKADILDAILKQRQIYGNMITHYRKQADGKPCLVFCRSIAASIETADRFNVAGYRFEPIDGNMTAKVRETLIDAVGSGQLHGLTSCELITYGLDVPRIQCIIMLRPTLSRALFYQMIGRGLRPSPGKKECVILDHVGNLFEHGHPLLNNEWNFEGRERRKRMKGINPVSLKLCENCYMYFDGSKCPDCGTVRGLKTPKPLDEVGGTLVEADSPVELKNRPPEERQEFQDRIGRLVDEANGAEGIQPGPIGELLAIADDLNRGAMWVYWSLSVGMIAVNVPLLHEICRQKKYKHAWVFHKRTFIADRLEKEAQERMAGL